MLQVTITNDNILYISYTGYMPENSSKQCSVNKYFQLHFFCILVLPSMGFEPTRLVLCSTYILILIACGNDIYTYNFINTTAF